MLLCDHLLVWKPQPAQGEVSWRDVNSTYCVQSFIPTRLWAYLLSAFLYSHWTLWACLLCAFLSSQQTIKLPTVCIPIFPLYQFQAVLVYETTHERLYTRFNGFQLHCTFFLITPILLRPVFCCLSLGVYTNTQFCSPHKTVAYLTQLAIGLRGKPRQNVCEGWPLDPLGLRIELKTGANRIQCTLSPGIVFQSGSCILTAFGQLFTREAESGGKSILWANFPSH